MQNNTKSEHPLLNGHTPAMCSLSESGERTENPLLTDHTRRVLFVGNQTSCLYFSLFRTGNGRTEVMNEIKVDISCIFA